MSLHIHFKISDGGESQYYRLLKGLGGSRKRNRVSEPTLYFGVSRTEFAAVNL